MLAINSIKPQMANIGKVFSKSGIKNKALAMAAVAALVPAIANARTTTEADKSTDSEKTVQVDNTAEKESQQDYMITTYYMAPGYGTVLPYNMRNQSELKIGANYNYNGTTKAQTLGPAIDVAGKYGGIVSGVFDLGAKAGWNMPSIEGKGPDLDAYAAIGIGADPLQTLNSRITLDIAGEGFVDSFVNKTETYDDVKGLWGLGGRLRATYQQVFGPVRMSLAALGSYGMQRNLNSNYSMKYVDNQWIIDDSERIRGTYARVGGELTFDFWKWFSIGVNGGYKKNFVTSQVTGESANNDSWDINVGAAFRFGN